MLCSSEQQAVIRTAGEALTKFGDQTISTVEQRTRKQPRGRGEVRICASDVGSGVRYGVELDEGQAVLNPEKRLDQLQMVLRAQGAAEGGISWDEEQVGAVLVREDEPHSAIAECAVSVKDKHGRGHGELDEGQNGSVSGLLDTCRLGARKSKRNRKVKIPTQANSGLEWATRPPC